MKNLFNLDNPVFRVLARVADFVILQVLFILCSLPVFTIGASITALARVNQTIIRDEDDSVVKPFFAAFRSNFKQATPVWLVGFLMIAGICADFLLLRAFVSGTLYTVCLVILFIFLFIVLGVLSYIFPLMARYDNTVRQHLQNAMVLFVTQLPRTVLMVFLNISPLLLGLFSMEVMMYTMVFWLFAGFSIISYLNSYVLKPVFDGLE